MGAVAPKTNQQTRKGKLRQKLTYIQKKKAVVCRMLLNVKCPVSQSVHVLILLHISVPYPSQSQSTLYSH